MSNITVTEINETLVVDSRMIAKELGIQHKNLIQNIRCHQTAIEYFGAVAFETREFKTAQGNSTQEVFAYLNEEQATFVMTLSRNTPKVIQCKQNLVRAFYDAKQAIKEKLVPKCVELLEENAKLKAQLADMGKAQRPVDKFRVIPYGATAILEMAFEDKWIPVFHHRPVGNEESQYLALYGVVPSPLELMNQLAAHLNRYGLLLESTIGILRAYK
jgi:Rha family phage regulatory protein